MTYMSLIMYCEFLNIAETNEATNQGFCIIKENQQENQIS
jgi:hypothetical protein